MNEPKIEFWMRDPETGHRFFHALEDLLLFIRFNEKGIEQAFPVVHMQWCETVAALRAMYISERGIKTKRQSGKTKRR